MENDDNALDPQLVTAIARSFWISAYNSEHPDASKEAAQEAWRQKGNDYRRVTRTALKRLAAQGITVSGTPATTDEA